MKRNIVKLSLVATMVLTTGSYANQIVGAEASATPEPNIQFGYGGLNMDNINVNVMTTLIDFTDGAYPDMALEDTYQSSVFAPGDNKSDEATRLGYVTQKIWPISEPTGLKVVNNDTATNKYKPNNCIMGSSYLGDANTSDADNTTFYLNDATPMPTLCSSYAGSSKRFQLIINENMVTEPDNDGYMKSIDLVFNIDDTVDPGVHKYQVFQKVTNHTGMRLDGLKVEVLNSAGQPQADLNISLGLGEGDPNIFEPYEMAFYPPGLWGDGSKDHLPIGWFDVKPSGYLVDGNGTSTITTTTALDGNYEVLYGNWLPNKWVGVGMHEEFDPTQEPALLAYWGTTPTEPNAEPAWHYGMYNNDEEFTNFTSPTPEELAAWAADMKTDDNPDGKYVIDDIEDLPNLSLNYIINVGEAIDNNFTIRFTPKVSVDQTPPSYFEADGVTRIEPPTAYLSSKGIAMISPEPTFVPGDTLRVAVADADLNVDPAGIETTVVLVSIGTDESNVTLTETAVNSSVFTGTFPTDISLADGTVVTATYVDESEGNATITATTEADSGTVTPPVTPPTTTPTTTLDPSTGGGGGCTYNPNSKSFDMTFLMLMALGLLYPFRRRFIK